MSALDIASERDRPEGHFDLDPLRAEILTTALQLTFLAAVFWAIWIPDHYRPATFLPSVTSATVLMAAYALVGRAYRLSALLFLVGLTIFAAWPTWIEPGSTLIYFLGIVVIAAGLFLGPGFDLSAALLTCLVVVAARIGPSGGLSESGLWTSLGLIAVCTLLSYAASRPLYTALDWSWHSFVQAREKMDEARERQVELGRVTKSLNESYIRLEELSRELDRARAVAEEARRLKAEFAANVSHELRTPLNLIVGFSEMMVMAPHAYEGESLPSAYRGDIRAIYRSARHLSSLIDDVLDLSQIEAGRMGLTKNWESLSEVVGEAVATVEVLFQSKGLYLSVGLPDSTPMVYVDRTRIRQILINLLNNAARFTEHGGAKIDVECEAEEVRIAVSDTGVGIDEEELPGIFDEFRQVKDSSGRHYEGSGLGLTICKRFVVLHGGSIAVESTASQGTTFHVRLPVWDPSPVSGLPAPWPSPTPLRPDNSRKVLVHEAESDALKIFQRYLDGYRVVAADAGQRGHAEAIIICASDWQEYWQKLQRIREFPRDVPVALCVLSDIQRVCERLGLAGYVTKPVARERLVEVLDQLGDGTRRILIVDDDPGSVRLLTRMIRATSKRYEVWRAYGGAEALSIAQQKRPDAILLDLMMPEMDGYAVLAELRKDERLADVPVVVVTAQDTTNQALVGNLLTFASPSGFSIGQLMGGLKAGLEALRGAPPPHGSEKEPRGSPVESPA